MGLATQCECVLALDASRPWKMPPRLDSTRLDSICEPRLALSLSVPDFTIRQAWISKVTSIRLTFTWQLLCDRRTPSATSDGALTQKKNWLHVRPLFPACYSACLARRGEKRGQQQEKQQGKKRPQLHAAASEMLRIVQSSIHPPRQDTASEEHDGLVPGSGSIWSRETPAGRCLRA